MIAEPDEIRRSQLIPPLDRRLFSLDPKALLILVAAGLIQTLMLAALIVQAVVFGRIVADVVLRHGTSGTPLRQLATLGAASAVVAASGYLGERTLTLIAGRMKSLLRNRILGAAGWTGAGRSSIKSGTEAMLLSTKGLDDLENYLIHFVPSAIYAVLAPLTLVTFTTFTDPLAGLTELATIAAVPPLMITLGRTAGSRAEEKWQSLKRLSGQFIESISAIATLKGIGAISRQERLIESASLQLERDTMSTLYLAFLSTGVLEVVTTVAIALVAVGIGIRLASGSIALAPSMTVLILAPPIYLSIRNASTQFHTTTDARVALEAIFSLLGNDRGLLKRDRSPLLESPAGENEPMALACKNLLVKHGGLLMAEDINLEIIPGDRLLIAGPSGSGKTTLLRLLAGLEPPPGGSVRYRGRNLAQLPGEELSGILSYMPQNPTFFEATIRENILIGREDPGHERMDEILASCLLTDLVSKLPKGLEHRISELGQAISAGQLQRVALARALLTESPILILDEPTSFLDASTEAAILRNLESATSKTILLFASHRPAMARLATSTLEIGSGRALRKSADGYRHA